MKNDSTNYREPSRKANELSHRIIGAAIEVHEKLGPGFLEKTYLNAMCVELAERNIKFEYQTAKPVLYKGRKVSHGIMDIVVDSEVIIEIKAVKRTRAIHEAQLMSYLRATDIELGLLINFNRELLKQGLERVVWTKH